MSSGSGPVAVIDIGSNSIKILVATRSTDGAIVPLNIRTIDARISAGISAQHPRLSEEGMARGLEAVRRLLADAAPFSPVATLLVATSAVRDAINGPDFRARVLAATGHEIRILTGEEEADLIGRGLTADPALRGLNDFYVFDLGGGSLECLAFRERRVEQATSLKLGCVRLTEMFVPDPAAPLSTATLASIIDHTKAVLSAGGFAFSLPPPAIAIGTGGTVSTLRAILGAQIGLPFEASDATVQIAHARPLLASIAALPLAKRKKITGLPPARADVFPTALATLIGLAELGGFSALQNSLYNLRYGLADAALS